MEYVIIGPNGRKVKVEFGSNNTITTTPEIVPEVANITTETAEYIPVYEPAHIEPPITKPAPKTRKKKEE